MPPEATERRTIPDLLTYNAEKHPDLPALSWKEDSGTWTTLTWSRTRDRVLELAAGFDALGIGPGDHVLLLMGNRHEHWLADVALAHLGAPSTTVYSTAAPDQIGYIARHSRARTAVVDTPGAAWHDLVDDPGIPLERLVVVDDPDPARGHVPFSSVPAPAGVPALLERPGPAPEDLLTVVYTSGTTGDPKGAALTHGDVLANVTSLDRLVRPVEHPEHVSYLPLAHIAERVLTLYAALLGAGSVWMCPDHDQLVETLRHVRPRSFFGVPRVWEKLASGVRVGLDQLPEDQRAAVDAAREVGEEHARRLEQEGPVPEELRARHEELHERVTRPVLAMIGLDRVEQATCASAPAPVELLRFWSGLGLVVRDVWGLTESVGVATANSSTHGTRAGSVGRPIDDLSVRIADDGEVFLRGTTLFSGYVRADGTLAPATDEDGWFPTGDLGHLDEDGYLWITGRKKDIIVTSGGKNVAPAPVEGALKEHPLVGQVHVHGDGRPYVVALVLLDPDTAPAWARSRGLDTGPDLADLAAHPEVVAEIDRAVAQANARLSRPEQVRRHRLLGDEWGPGTGELTPTLKLRRPVVEERYAAVLDALYTPDTT